MRKWISFLLAGALMIGCLPTLADKPAKKVSYYLDADGKVNLYISLGTDAYGEVMLNVFEKDFDISTFSGLADDETKASKLKFSKQSTLKNGCADFEFNLSDGTGYYPYIVTSQLNGTEESGEIAYLDIDDIAVLDIINGMTSQDVLDKYLDENNMLVFGNNSFYLDSDQSEQLIICAELISGKPYSSLSELVNAAYKVNLIETLNTASDNERIAILSAYGEILGLDKPEYTVFGSADMSFRKDVVECMKGDNYTDVGFYVAVDLTALKNTTNYTEVKPILTRLKNSSAVDLSNYFSLANTSSVDAALVGGNYSNPDELKRAIDALIPRLSLGNGSGNGTGSYGGNSSGGGGGGATVYVPVNEDTNKRIFSDLEGYDWAKAAVEVLAENGIINGKTSDTFAPGDYISREELVKMLVSIFGIYDDNAISDFNDLNGHWSAPYIASAQKYGLVKGVSDKSFGTGMPVNRQDMAVLCYRFMNAFTVKMELTETEEFKDIDSISDYAKEAVTVLKNARVINGKENGVFAPNDYCTRAEAAKVLYYIFTEKNL